MTDNGAIFLTIIILVIGIVTLDLINLYYYKRDKNERN